MTSSLDKALTVFIRSVVREELRSIAGSARPADPPHPLRLYSVKSAAKLLEVSPDYLYDRINDGTIRALVNLGGGKSKYRIRAEDLHRFIESRTTIWPNT